MSPAVESLVQPLPTGSGAGDDLTYDKAFLEFSRATAGSPERGVGNEITPAEDPEWPDVVKRGTALFQRTHDLRVAVQLARSWLYLEGFPGLAQGLELVGQLLTQSWDAVHPRADDDGDLTTRFNTLSALTDEELFLQRVRTLPLAKSRALGVVSLRDSRIASGKLKLTTDSTETPPDRSRLDAIFADARLEDLQVVAAGSAQSLKFIHELQELIDTKAPGHGPDFIPLRTDMSDIVAQLNSVIAKRSGLDVTTGDSTLPDLSADAATLHPSVGVAVPGGIVNRADVIRTLDAVCAYYRDCEPSSPVPMLITRAKRLVNLSFLEALRDLSPATISDLERIAGIEQTS